MHTVELVSVTEGEPNTEARDWLKLTFGGRKETFRLNWTFWRNQCIEIKKASCNSVLSNKLSYNGYEF